MENWIGIGCMYTGPLPAECLGEVIMTRLWTEGGGFGGLIENVVCTVLTSTASNEHCEPARSRQFSTVGL